MINGSILVDECDRHFIKAYRWHAVRDGYAATSQYHKGKKGERKSPQAWLLHRIILEAPPELEVDHINGNVLDNRRSNLRLTDHSANMQNRTTLGSANRSGVRGVYWDANCGKWRPKVGRKSLGCFSDLAEAAKVACDYRKTTMPGYICRCNSHEVAV